MKGRRQKKLRNMNIMKKNLFTFSAAFIVMLAFASCNYWNLNYLKDLDYRKACAEKDFEKAYQIVDAFKDISKDRLQNWRDIQARYGTMGPKQEGAEDAYQIAVAEYQQVLKYVVLQEALFVLESEGSNGLMRIIGIAKEHQAEGWLYPELLDVAKKIGNKDLTEKIQNIINPSGTDEGTEEQKRNRAYEYN